MGGRRTCCVCAEAADPRFLRLHFYRPWRLRRHLSCREAPLDPEEVLGVGSELERCWSRIRCASGLLLDCNVSLLMWSQGHARRGH